MSGIGEDVGVILGRRDFRFFGLHIDLEASRL
jgi:hypothetical protein